MVDSLEMSPDELAELERLAAFPNGLTAEDEAANGLTAEDEAAIAKQAEEELQAEMEVHSLLPHLSLNLFF